jgi:hypothetical protein
MRTSIPLKRLKKIEQWEIVPTQEEMEALALYFKKEIAEVFYIAKPFDIYIEDTITNPITYN